MGSKKDEHKKLKEEIEKEVEELNEPFTAQEIVKELGIAWNTAKETLLELSLEGKIKAIKTTNGYIFLPKRGEKDE